MNTQEWKKKIETLKHKDTTYDKEYRELMEKHNTYVNKKKNVDQQLYELTQPAAMNAYARSPKGYSDKMTKLQNSSIKLANMIQKTEIECNVIMRKIMENKKQLRNANLAIECMRTTI